MTKIPQSSPIVKVIDVPTAIGPLRLAFDADGGRWTPLAQISMYCGAPLHLLTNKAENRYWGARTFARVGFCLSVPKLQEFLESTKPTSFFSAGKLADFEWMRSHAARILRNHPECEIPGPRGMESAQGVTPRLLPEDELTPKSNLPIHSMPMPETKAAPVAELLPIRILPLGDDQVNAISARDLHAFLGVGKDFTTWIKDRIEMYEFQEHRDFEIIDVLRSPESGSAKARTQNAKEYTLTLDMAKELAMVERNEKGKQARQYFLECERMAKNPIESLIPKTLPEALRAYAVALDEKAALSCKVEEQQTTISILAPKADGLDRLTITTDGAVSLTEAAKLLQQPPRKFTAWLQQIAWVYRSGKHLLPYQDRIHTGMMEHKVVIISEEISVPQAVITPKGLANLSAKLGKVAA